MHSCMGWARVRAMLDWDDLRYFLAVARAGSLSAAARALGVAQPTMGRRIGAFERRVGARLFVANPNGQKLSATGRRILAHAEQMERDALAAERITSGRDAGLSGPLCITASEWLIQSVLAPLLAPFVARHGELQLELLADARHLSLVRREADIALRPSRFEHQEVVQREVAIVSFGLYASDGYLAEHGAPDFDRQCEGHALIGMSESLGKVPDVEWLPRVAARARVVLRTNGREPMARMAAAGMGITCLPRFIGDATPGLRLLPAPAPAPARQLWLGLHRDARAVPRVKASAAFLSESIARLRPALHPEQGRAQA
ncbi:MAG TPA: LysR family transcriptional regulator [Polyangiaceae bacterium]|nr:LysR family transcriptional regulator [Polyangiaceae bacterium]